MDHKRTAVLAGKDPSFTTWPGWFRVQPHVSVWGLALATVKMGGKSQKPYSSCEGFSAVADWFFESIVLMATFRTASTLLKGLID